MQRYVQYLCIVYRANMKNKIFTIRQKLENLNPMQIVVVWVFCGTVVVCLTLFRLKTIEIHFDWDLFDLYLGLNNFEVACL